MVLHKKKEIFGKYSSKLFSVDMTRILGEVLDTLTDTDVEYTCSIN